MAPVEQKEVAPVRSEPVNEYEWRHGFVVAERYTQSLHTLVLVMIVEVVHDLESVDLAYCYRLRLPAPELLGAAV
ncbi:hypothetical protein [Streptomyces wedmorensis]|uniref:hypothetical protein n=1 Tax=Streptomyces wedmorensis TaxID=43759 RepID=UPI0037904E31